MPGNWPIRRTQFIDLEHDDLEHDHVYHSLAHMISQGKKKQHGNWQLSVFVENNRGTPPLHWRQSQIAVQQSKTILKDFKKGLQNKNN